MATFSENITTEGQALLARMLSGDANITFTKMVLGDGNVTVSEMANIRNVVNPKVTLDIHSVLKDSSNNVTVTSIFSNTELGSGFYYREKGLYATDGSTEILFLYGNNGTLAEWISPGGSQVVEKKIISVLTFSESAEINVTLQSGVYVTSEELEEHNTDAEAHPDMRQQISVLSNPNLLINGDFRINQRGQNEYCYTGKYTADRWCLFHNAATENLPTVQCNDGYITLDTTNVENKNVYMVQKFESDRFLNFINNIFSISIRYRSNVPFRLQFGNNASMNCDASDDWETKSFTAKLTSITQANYGLIIQAFDTATATHTSGKIDIKWVKLELGEFATPFIPRNYQEELALCQRYYRAGYQRATGDDTWGQYLSGVIFEQPMRTTPTFTVVDGKATDLQNIIATNVVPHTNNSLSAYGCKLLKTSDGSQVFNGHTSYGYYWTADAEIY